MNAKQRAARASRRRAHQDAQAEQRRIHETAAGVGVELDHEQVATAMRFAGYELRGGDWTRRSKPSGPTRFSAHGNPGVDPVFDPTFARGYVDQAWEISHTDSDPISSDRYKKMMEDAGTS